MFNSMGLSRRLILIVIIINLSMLVVVALMANSSADAALRAQAISRFAEKNRETALAITGRLALFQAFAEQLGVQIMQVDDLNDATALRQFLVAFLAGRTDDPLINRINMIRPDGSVTVLYLPNPTDADEYIWRVYRQEMDMPDDPIIGTIRQNGRLSWFYQATTMYDSEARASVSIGLPYTHPQGTGMLWVDMPISILRDEMQNAANNEGLLSESLRGYALLINQDGMTITALDLPETSMNIAGQTTQLLATQRSATRTNEGLYRLPDPFNQEQIGLFGFNLIQVNLWRFVSVLPENEIPDVPSNIFLPIVILSIAGISVLIVSVNLFIQNAVVNPLVDLGRSATEIGEGNLRFIVFHLEKRDEIGRLAQALDTMRDRLRESYDDLQRWSTTLERRVDERTEQLTREQQRAESSARQIRAVYDESLSVVNEPQLRTVLDAFIHRILTLMDSTYCAIWLLAQDGQYLQLVATNDPRRRRGSHMVIIHRSEGIVGEAVRRDAPVILNDYLNYPHRVRLSEYYETDEAPFSRAVCAPLRFAGQVIGAVVIGRPAQADPYEEDDEHQLALFANIVAPSVRNAQLLVELQDAVAEAKRANEVKTRFLASVTHELRTPLNLVINNMDFMRVGTFGKVNTEQVHILNQTVRSAEHLLYLINDLLDVSKIEAGEMQVFIQRTDVHTMLEDAVDNAYALLETYENKEQVELRIDIDANLPEIPMDARRIRQVLNNLLSNAIKFTPQGTVTLKVFATDAGIQFSVHDTGMGIPEEEMDLLFEAFERTSTAKQRGIEGTGLGLPISRYLVQKHNSDITVISQVGLGSTFAFTLPYHLPENVGNGAKYDTRQIQAILQSGIE